MQEIFELTVEKEWLYVLLFIGKKLRGEQEK